MALLSGLNYDYSTQSMSILVERVEAIKTELTLDNTEGFAQNDFLIIAPNTERAEIVSITAAVSKNEKITISATKFPHDVNTKVFRTNFNQMKFYECATSGGTYTLCAGGTINMQFSTNYTNFDFTGATANYYYKRTFYNSATTAESDIDSADYWQVTDESLYVTPVELRTYLQFDDNDFPTLNDFSFFIKIAQVNVDLDMDSGNSNILFIATLLQSRVEVMKALASRALSKGYIQVNAEGRIITKAYQELRLEAENAVQEYKEFVLRNNRREVTSTNFMDDTTIIDSWTRTDIIQMMNGTSNAENFGTYFGYKRYN